MKLIYLLTCLLALTGAVQAAEETLAVSIAVPFINGKHIVRYSSKGIEGHINVVLTNVSKEGLRVYQQNCAPGFETLYFEITDETGKTWIVKRDDQALWSSGNAAYYLALRPGESAVFQAAGVDGGPLGQEREEKFKGMGGVWRGFPMPKADGWITCTVRAVYENKDPAYMYEAKGIWTGLIYSKPVQITFYN